MRRRRKKSDVAAVAVVVAAAAGIAAVLVINPGQHAATPVPFQPVAAPTVSVPPVPNENAGAPITLRWPDGRPLRVLFVGDSITQGRITSDPSRDYVSLVTGALERHGPISPTVDWKSGSPVEYWMRQTFPDVDLAIVELGTNEKSVPIQQFAGDYVHLMRTIHRDAPNAKIVCLSMWRPDQTINAFADLNKSILYGCTGAYADLTAAAHVKANISTQDHFHPDDAGHAAIARDVLEMIHVR